MTKPIALLVVHGIGSQKRGETLTQCAAGLRMAYPNATLLNRAGAGIDLGDITHRGLDQVTLRQGPWQVNLYEVYWADILGGANVEASFNKSLLEETTWFPWFNYRRGLLAKRWYSGLVIRLRIALLWLLQWTASVIYEIVPRRLHAKILDQIVADVWNYVHSLREALPAVSPIRGAGEAILSRFRVTALRAREDGCGEVQILAHSLGTVIAYNALTRYSEPGIQRIPNPITRLYTIGSPLEKVLFIWASLLRPALPRPEIQMNGEAIATGPGIRWHNFYSPMDLISGKLTSFKTWGTIDNHHIWGLGGLAQSHVHYFNNRIVLAAVSEGLAGDAQPITLPWRLRARSTAEALLENLGLPLGILLATALGIVVFLAFGAMLTVFAASIVFLLYGWPVNAVLGRFGIHIGYLGTIYWAAIAGAFIFLPFVTVFMTRDGYRRAKAEHRAFWQ